MLSHQGIFMWPYVPMFYCQRLYKWICYYIQPVEDVCKHMFFHWSIRVFNCIYSCDFSIECYQHQYILTLEYQEAVHSGLIGWLLIRGLVLFCLLLQVHVFIFLVLSHWGYICCLHSTKRATHICHWPLDSTIIGTFPRSYKYIYTRMNQCVVISHRKNSAQLYWFCLLNCHAIWLYWAICIFKVGTRDKTIDGMDKTPDCR